MKKLVIAIDGPVGSGKSSAAQRVAELLGYKYLDSGAMYRALGWMALERGVPLDSAEPLEKLAAETRIDFEALGTSKTRVLVDGTDVTQAIRSPEVSRAASKVAVVPGVRRLLVAQQRRVGAQGGVVMEGRDIGTVVFPDAGLKIYLDASVEVRAERRWREHQQNGEQLDPAEVIEEVHERDRRDRERDASPLARARDAVVIDNTGMNLEDTARIIVMLAKEKAGGKAG